MSGSLHILPLAPGDQAALAHLWRASVRYMGLDQPKLTDLAFFEGKLADVAQTCEVWVAWTDEPDRERMGFLALDLPARVLDQLFIHPDAFGAGVGRSLLDHAKMRLPDGFTLYTPTANARARRFYEAGGMVVTHDDVHPVWGHPVTHYRWPAA
ncbi:GNAT family N-acetyltransferase [Maritimibacter dapengensis]|uniref:GNAT family N-acetyltransferase n=1 Tax=Maritimibacter dapengensis TaxID=2836868 RepID=A0ABS6SZJ4_9RHOB|nr:GNAT family N-acetyltransferase [Maritimibacter dapengensis]MBV7378397.1 GNAT family N-acetyltransferase [Maritimibacter dapengensis]